MVVSAKSGIIQYAEGEAFLDGKPIHLSQGSYLQMANGQALRTGRGRIELLLAPDIYLRLAEASLMKLEQNQLTDVQIALEQGSALIEVVQKPQAGRIQAHISTGLAEIREAGLYRLDAGSGELRVYGGSALVSNGKNNLKVKRGKKAHLDNFLTSAGFNVNAADDLHKWAAQRSFDLFIASPQSRTQRHWKPIAMGWLINNNYRTRYFSATYLEQWRAAQESQARADEEARKQALEKLNQVTSNQAMTDLTAATQAAISQAQAAASAKTAK
jgi:hypothetical protein